MTTIPKKKQPGDLVASIERGLDRLMTSPTQRIRGMRLGPERVDNKRQHEVEVHSREFKDTLEMAAVYPRGLPNS
jgi:hypothetical protein